MKCETKIYIIGKSKRTGDYIIEDINCHKSNQLYRLARESEILYRKTVPIENAEKLNIYYTFDEEEAKKYLELIKKER